MRSFYSIIQISPNIAAGDKLAVGLIYFDGSQFQIYFSKNKRQIAERLIANKNVNVKSILDQFTRKTDQLNSNLENKELLFENSSQWTNSNYFNYLSSYSNGLIQFSQPKSYLSTGNDKEFDGLVEMLLNERIEQSINVQDYSEIRSTIENKLIKRVSNKVHTHYKFDHESFPSLHFNYELDCIGKNGSLIGAKSFEFDQSEQTIKGKMSNYYALILMLSSKHHQNIETNNFYLISSEPKSSSSAEHELWETAVRNELIQVLDPEQADKVADTIEENNAQKFLKQ